MGKRRSDQPPGPRGRWLIGNTLDYDRDRIGFIRRNQAKYGDVFSFSPSTVVIGDPDLMHEVLANTNEAFLTEGQLLASPRDQARDEAAIDGWMLARRLSWPGMTKSVIRAHGQRILSMFDDTLRAVGGAEFDVAPVMRHYSGQMVGDFLFGSDADDVVANAVVRHDRSEHFMNTNLTVPKWLPLPRVRGVIRARREARKVIEAHIRSRRVEPHRPPEDLLDLLVAEPASPAEANEPAAALTDDQIAYLFGSTMLASLGSPGAVLSWIVLELARHADICERVRAEATSLLAETGTVLDDSRLPYTKAFVSEILRLYPPTWLMGRFVRRPYTLGGWKLHPGQEVRFSLYLVQRDPRWWPQPDELRVERWLESTTERDRRAYFPFGGGPRICIGLHLGMYQLMIATAHLASHYEITVANQDITATTGPVLLPGGLRARLAPIPAPSVGEARAGLGGVAR